MQVVDLAVASPALPALALALACVAGAVMGGFANCLAWRAVHGEGALRGRSRCATCGHPLSALDLVPVLSWVLLRGKCRYCGGRVPARYVAAELLCAVYFASIVWAYGLTVHALALCALGCILLGLSLVDLDTRTIPNGFIIAGIAVWLATFWAFGVDPGSMGLGSLMYALAGTPLSAVLIDGLLGAFVVAGALLGLSLAFDKATGRQSLGGGDVKLVFVAGLYVGLAGNVLNLILACAIGLVFAALTRRGREGTDDPKAFPFGPSIALATWLTLLAGPQLLGLYFALY